MIGTKMSKGREGKREKHGARYLENPPKPREYKAPISAYVHYESMGGDQVAFEVSLGVIAVAILRNRAEHPSNVVEHSVCLKMDPDARLIVLPSSRAE